MENKKLYFSCTTRLAYLISIAILLGICGTVFAEFSGTDAMLVWSRKGESGYDVFITRRTDLKWLEPKQLSFSECEEILPTVAFSLPDHVWVVWSEILEGMNSRLRYRYFSDGKWSPSSMIQSDTSSDLAASIIVDKNRDTWLVWSGTDTTDDDIYFARWNRTSWTPPERVNIDDEMPDVLPRLALNNRGLPHVTWIGFDGHQYKPFSSEWDGERWTTEIIVDNEQQKQDTASSDDLITLPDFVKDLSQASVYIQRGNKIKILRFEKKE